MCRIHAICQLTARGLPEAGPSHHGHVRAVHSPTIEGEATLAVHFGMMKQTKRLERQLETLATRIRNRRRTLGLIQEQLAEKSGLSANYIARLEIADKTMDRF
jgi:ribosome-binding protein aMBF1 (putative translation factor)